MSLMLFQGNFLEIIPFLIGALVPALTFHEWGHAAMAKVYGDDTAEREGRLSLNPLVHLDPMGTLAIFLIGFGWAKPVPVNPSNMKGKWGDFWVSAAGPLMNIALALGFALLIRFDAYLILGAEYASVLMKLFQISLILNLALAFFNLLPIGPLDGNHMLARLLPYRSRAGFVNWNARFGSMVLFGLIIAEWILPVGPLRFFVLIPTSFASQMLLA